MIDNNTSPPNPQVEEASSNTASNKNKCMINQLPKELIDKIVDHLAEEEVVSTAEDMRSFMLSCKDIFVLVKEPLYKFNERLSLNHYAFEAKKQPFWITAPDEIRWNGRSALDYAIDVYNEHEPKYATAALETARSVIEITPHFCQLSHVRDAIAQEKYEIAWLLLEMEVIRAKLEAGIDRESPIFPAVAANQTEMVDYIIGVQGLDVFKPDHESKTVLHHACENGHLSLVRRFLHENSQPKAHIWKTRIESPMAFAIMYQDSEVRKAMVNEILTLEPGVEEAVSEQYTRTIAAYDHDDVLEILIDRGTFSPYINDPGLDYQRWRTFLSLAAQQLAQRTFQRLLKHDPRKTKKDFPAPWLILSNLSGELFNASDHVPAQMARTWIDYIRSTDKNDLPFLTYDILETTIINGIRNDSVGLVDYLFSLCGPLKPGQMPSYNQDQPTEGRTDYTEGPCSLGMLQAMVKSGFDVNQRSRGRTTLEVAITDSTKEGKGFEVVKELSSTIREINPVSWTDGKFETILHKVVSVRHSSPIRPEGDALELTAHLLDNGADISARDTLGNTPLHIAVSRGYPSVIRLLLDRGADANVQNHNGETPLHDLEHDHETRFTNGEKIRLLLDYHADPNIISNNGCVALHLGDCWCQSRAIIKTKLDIYTQAAQKLGDPVNIKEFVNRTTRTGSLPLVSRAASTNLGHCTRLFDVSATDYEGFEYFLELGADIDLYDNHNNNPMKIALRRSGFRTEEATEENRPFFMYLLRKGANINATNHNGKTILDVQIDDLSKSLLRRHGALLSSELGKS